MSEIHLFTHSLISKCLLLNTYYVPNNILGSEVVRLVTSASCGLRALAPPGNIRNAEMTTLPKSECAYVTRSQVDLGLPGGTSDREPSCQCSRHKRHRFNPWVGKIPWEEGMATHSTILAWRIPWREKPGELQSIWS